MVRIDAQAGTGAEAGLLEPFAVGAFQGDRLEQDYHHQIQTPNLVRLPEAIYSAHLALLVRIGQDAHGGLLLRDAVDKVLPAVVGDVLAQFPQQTGGPLLLGFRIFVLKIPLALVLLVVGHLFLMLLEVPSLRRLQVEPGVAERLHVRQQGFDERVEIFLLLCQKRPFDGRFAIHDKLLVLDVRQEFSRFLTQ